MAGAVAASKDLKVGHLNHTLLVQAPNVQCILAGTCSSFVVPPAYYCKAAVKWIPKKSDGLKNEKNWNNLQKPHESACFVAGS